MLGASSLLVLAGCALMPERVRDVPELSGKLTRSRVPVGGATITVLRLQELASATVSCTASLASTNTDSAGAFQTPGHHRWILKGALMQEAADTRKRGTFAVCVRDPRTSVFRVLFRGALNVWDTLRLACDLDRSWLAADRNGSEGQCVVLNASLDAQPLARRSGIGGPVLTCDTITTLISAGRIGPMRMNGSIEELRRVCPGVRDTVLHTEGLVGVQTERAHVLNIAGAPVVIRKGGGVIASLEVASPVLRTKDSIGVGTPVVRLLDLPNLHVVSSAMNQGPYVFAWHGDQCGIGYSLSRRANDIPDMKGTPIRPERLRAWPRSTSVRRVIVGFCPRM